MDSTDTIAAIVTAPGEAAVAVLRISGPEALAVADRVFDGSPPPSRRPSPSLSHGVIRDAAGRTLDDVLLLVMRGPRSYTGEDVVEIHGHGGRVAPRRLLRCLIEAGCRPAEPGEFTRRAFLNGKLDLLQAEAILDLVRARSDRAASAAVEQMQGALSKSVADISQGILDVAAEVEASLDFPEEELDPAGPEALRARLREARQRIAGLLATWDEGRLLREGARVVLLGRPNAGKSTLFNALLGSERAIVSEHPGTTRDTIEETLLVEGIPVVLVDTAGLRDSDCEIERAGIERARSRMRGADLCLYLVDASAPLHPEDLAFLRETAPPPLVVWTKTDLGRHPTAVAPRGTESICVVPTTGEGLEELSKAIHRTLLTNDLGEHPGALVSERHRSLLVEADRSIGEAETLLAGSGDLVVPAATQLREALERLGEITGRTYHDGLLDAIFRRFCVGK